MQYFLNHLDSYALSCIGVSGLKLRERNFSIKTYVVGTQKNRLN